VDIRNFTSTVAVVGLLVGVLGVSPAFADDWVPEQIEPTDNALVWSRATLEDRVSLDQHGRRPPVDPQSRTFLLYCERDIQLDCIESIGLVTPDGTYAVGAFIAGHTEDVVEPGYGDIARHSTTWSLPGLTLANGQPVTVRLQGSYGGPDSVGLTFGMFLEGFESVAGPETEYGCLHGQTDPCLLPPVLPEGTTFRVDLRMSWFTPSVVRARALEARFTSQSLGTGAHRYTVTGGAMLLQVQSEQARETGVPEYVSSSFDFFMWDPRLWESRDSSCYLDGPIVYSFNGLNGGAPIWNSGQGRLELNVAAAHHWPDGAKEWRGYYETVIPDKTARCLWGIDPRRTSAMRVEVFTEDGEEKAATIGIAYRNAQVTIRAYDFTYSSPTIAVTIKVAAGQSCFKKGAKIGKFTCTQKGKKLVWVKARR